MCGITVWRVFCVLKSLWNICFLDTAALMRPVDMQVQPRTSETTTGTEACPGIWEVSVARLPHSGFINSRVAATVSRAEHPSQQWGPWPGRGLSSAGEPAGNGSGHPSGEGATETRPSRIFKPHYRPIHLPGFLN